ncbi:site-specific tyrosine recombinase/integron integrase [Salibacterium qingdaonense]|uniref:Integrase/recombinase XerD n=1 Tax=Salibacterium qingdaonense TaxID=266892 RepID=A0A1I4KQP7_9BACI|nr:site-specific tyrosine recombinase/integron integrase [Salibacterium qingdaonense]SFL80869.1 integrase/recombinase XerD [Salibacterium qingdaonense]
MNTVTAGEQMLSDIVAYISELVPVNVEETKSRLSQIVSKYHVTKVEEYDKHPDLQEKMDMFLATKKLEGCSHHTLDGYRRQLRMFADQVKRRAEDITAADIRAYLASFEDAASATISTKLSVLQSFFSWLTGEELIPRDPTMKVKAPKKEKRAPKALTIEELEMLRESCDTYRRRAMIEVLYATGCRLGEVQPLNRSQVNIQDQSALVYGKGGKERTVYFSPKAIYYLRKYLMNRTDDDEALFVSERKPHGRLSRRGIQQELAKVARAAGLENKVSPHVLRHTMATLTINNGAELGAVQEMLGHASSTTTLRYAVYSQDRIKQHHKRHLVQ